MAPYLFILATDVLGHMLDDPKHGVVGLSLPRGGSIKDQTFADNTAIYLQGSPANMDKVQDVLKLFCHAFEAKINWNKSAAIWASKKSRTWTWGEDVGLKWILEGEGTCYLGIQVGFHLPTDANFDRMMLALKGKLITWSHNNLSLTGRILVANQVLLTSMWYLAASWNPNPRMCSQVRGVVRNFIWGGKAVPTRAKVKWDTLALSPLQRSFGIIDPKTQFEALLAKLLVRGLAPGEEPWKKLVRHRADQTSLPVHGKGPDIPDINWLLTAPKFKRISCSMWKSIVGAWIKVRPRLAKSDPTNLAETLRQPLFGNLSITNSNGSPLGVNGLREGCTIARQGCSRVKDIWSPEHSEWKSLSNLGLSHHPANVSCMNIITTSIPWRADERIDNAQARDWISNPTLSTGAPLNWVYYVLESTPGKANVIEFKKTSHSGRIQATSHQALTISTNNYC